VTRSVRLFYGAWSHYCVCAELALAMKGVPATIVTVPYHDKTELLAATGQDYSPALDWDGTIVPWTDIAEFLEAKVPSPSLYPYGDRGIPTILERWGHQVLEEKVWRAVVTRMPATFSDEKERWVFEEIQRRVRGPWEVLEQRRDEFLADLAKELAWVDAALEGREWLLAAPSLADCGIYGGLSSLRVAGEALPAGLKNLARWVERVERLRATGPAATAAVPRPQG
jgi:glutathione S-transferase